MSELNNAAVVAQRPSVQLVNADGVTMLELLNEQSKTEAVMAKGVATGVMKREWHIRNTVKQVKDGEAMAVVGDNGEAQLLTELKVTVKTYSADAIAAKRDADALKSFVANLRKRLGLSKSKQVVADRDKLTVADVSDWMLGKREVMGKAWDSLSDKLKADCSKVHAEASKPKGAAGKPATPTAVMQALAAALESEGKLDAETKAQVEAVLARQAKGKVSASERNASKPTDAEIARNASVIRGEEVTMTEQSDI